MFGKSLEDLKLKQTKTYARGENHYGLLSSPNFQEVINFLVDSDVIIWYLKGREKEAELLENLSQKGKLLFSVVTITEIRVGITKNSQKVISGLKDIFIPIDITPEIAELAGEFKQKYKLDIADMLIAASAATTNSTLVTYNRKHFPMPQVSLYKPE